MKSNRLITSIVVSVLTSLSGAPLATADDADIYTLPPTFSTDAAPKVLLILDTSGSMDSVVASRPDYDSGHDYITPFKAANPTSPIATGRIYWDSRSGGLNAPAHNSSKWFPDTVLQCKAATDYFATAANNGYFGDGTSSSLMVQHRSNSNQRWTSLASGNTQPVDCKADADGSDRQSDRVALSLDPYLNGQNDADGYRPDSSNKYSWSTNNAYRVRLYTANYIAYLSDASLATSRSRITIAKVALKEIVDDNPQVHFGLMAFNANSGDGSHGGRIVQAVGDPTEVITYEDTDLSAVGNTSDTVIKLTDSSRFAVGDNIGIELNSGTIHWTTVAGNVRTTLSADMDTSTTTATVVDATGFAATDDIGIRDNKGRIEWRTVSSKTGNDITISSSLNNSALHTLEVFGRTITLTDALPSTANAAKKVYGRSTRQERVKDQVESLIADGSTPLSESLYEAYRYFAGKPVVYGNPTAGVRVPGPDSCAQDPNNCGPGDSPTLGTYHSPLVYECEKSYIVMVTDGAPTSDTDEQQYLTSTNFPPLPAADGQVIASTPRGSNGDGLVPLAEWMNKNDINQNIGQTQTGRFYAVTFGSGISATAKALLDEATQKGTGDPTKAALQADDVADLKTAFETIIGDIKIETASFGAPTLSVNAFNKLYNRDEVYFALFEPSKKYRWNGNLKKFRLCNSSDATLYGCSFGDIIDRNNADVIDLTNKRIKTSAQSFWGTGTDGNVVTAGGAGEASTALNPDSQRRLYTWRGTYSGASYPLTLTKVEDATGNALFDAADPAASPTPGDPTILGLPSAASTSTSDVTKLVGWMMGKDSYDEDGDAATTTRWSVADPLHSRPVAITYGIHNSDPTLSVVKLVMAGNDGAIRMFNDDNGKEEWAFIPQEMLEHQATLTGGDGKHVYGIDNTVTVWTQDNNNNGIIEPQATTDPSNPLADKVYIYASMRRGPQNDSTNFIYAFDATPTSTITDKDITTGITPKLLWVIEAGAGSYTQLGQSWSAPRVATIRVKASGPGSVAKRALIFGGGYDPGVESTGVYPTVENKVVTKNNNGSRGNAIFIVDATTGDRLWWASNATVTDGSSYNADLQLPDMNYPIPSDLTLIDSNGDSAIDRIYAGDVGGQVFRVDLDPEINPAASSPSLRNAGTKGYLFADLVCDRASTLTGTPARYARICPGTDDPQEWRRVFYAPDVVSVKDKTYLDTGESERLYDMVFVVTGDRPDPMDRLTSTGLVPAQQPVHNAVYGLKDTNQTYGPVASAPRPITPHGATSDVHDATANLIESGTAAEQAVAATELRDRKGWMVYFKESSVPAWTNPPDDPIGVAEGAGRTWIGEKSLARPVVFGGVVYVTTFTPANSGMTSATCEPNEGLGKVYGLNFLDAKIAVDLNGDGTKERSINLGGGIPSELVTVIREDGTTGLVGSSGGATQVGLNQGAIVERTFWYQE